jgi:porin
VRLRAQAGAFTLLGGVFQDNPPGGPFNSDSQLLGSTRWGGNFNLRTGALIIAELQYALNQPRNGEVEHGDAPGGLPGTYKLGFWIDTAQFPSPRFDNQGLPLASPASNGVPLALRNNVSLYAVMDQQVWRPDPSGPQALGVFARLMGGPGDRNLISFAVNTGITLKAPLKGRNSDTLGLGFGLGKIGSAAAGFDSDTAFFTRTNFPVRSSETFVELTYQAQITLWLLVQPDLQAIFNVGGGVLNPDNPTQRIGNALVIGVRSTVTF